MALTWQGKCDIRRVVTLSVKISEPSTTFYVVYHDVRLILKRVVLYQTDIKASLPAAAKRQQLPQSSAQYTYLPSADHILLVNNIFWGNSLQTVICINIPLRRTMFQTSAPAPP